MNRPPLIQIQKLVKRYGAATILDGIDLSIGHGEFVSFIGPSGCGKSTLLRLVAGLTPITEGGIVVDGMTPENAREECFFVFQEANLLPWRTAAANVELPLMLRGDITTTRRERARCMLELVGLGAAGHKYPWQLSGGMKMRVSIARALSVAPKILLLDEPFGALDEMTRDQLNEDLLRLRETDPFTALFVTHSVTEAVFLSTRIVVLSANPGRTHRIIDVPFAYPRPPELRESAEFLRLLAATAQELRAVRH